MADKSLEGQRKRQKILLIIALGIFLIAAVILYFGIFQGRGPASEIPIGDIGLPGSDTDRTSTWKGSAVSDKKLERINLDFEFLVEQILPFLKSHGDLPVKKGETGRDHPYIPYWLEQLEVEE